MYCIPCCMGKHLLFRRLEMHLLLSASALDVASLSSSKSKLLVMRGLQGSFTSIIKGRPL